MAAEPQAPGATVELVTVDEGHKDQRIDNFLVRICKGVPRSHVYQMIRSGQVRVNGKRVSADLKLQVGDRVRVPPFRGSGRSEPAGQAHPGVVHRGAVVPVSWEDDGFLVVEKPAGMAVHGGSGVSMGVIELLRRERSEARFLELVHRLDRDTSGVLLVAKRRPALLALQQQFRDRRTNKTYLAIVCGRWPLRTRLIDQPLQRLAAPDGDRRVRVNADGREARSWVTGLVHLEIDGLGIFTLVGVRIETGRTHQIRVHLASSGFPVAGDEKYGDFALNRALARRGHRRMFLHAWRLEIDAPEGATRLRFEADPGDAFARFVHEGSERRMTTQSWTGLMPARHGSFGGAWLASNHELSEVASGESDS